LIIDSEKARQFTNSYMGVTLALIDQNDHLDDHLSLIALGRQRLLADPKALAEIVKRRTREGLAPDPDAVEAIRTLRLGNWVYLRDTNAYSIFLDADLEAAYAVYGLTQRVSDLIGDSGAVIECGLVEYDGKFVCDGIISMLVWLGSSYRRELNEELARLRREGRFFRFPEPPIVSVPPSGRAARRKAPASRRA